MKKKPIKYGENISNSSKDFNESNIYSGILRMVSRYISYVDVIAATLHSIPLIVFCAVINYIAQIGFKSINTEKGV